MIAQKPPEQGLRVKRSPEFKLKDKESRKFIILRLADFGFIPETLIIEKVHGRSNTFVVQAVMTEEEIKKEDKRIKEFEKQTKFVMEQKLQVEKKEHGRTTDKPTAEEAGATEPNDTA